MSLLLSPTDLTPLAVTPLSFPGENLSPSAPLFLTANLSQLCRSPNPQHPTSDSAGAAPGGGGEVSDGETSRETAGGYHSDLSNTILLQPCLLGLGLPQRPAGRRHRPGPVETE